MVAGATDYFDGKIARWLGQTSRLGVLLDPAADRLYILATLFAFVVRDIIPWWLAALIVGRDLVLAPTVPLLRRHGYGPLQVSYLGKAATFNLLYAFPLLLIGAHDWAVSAVAQPVAWAFVIWGTALYLWSGALYLVQVGQLVRADRPAPRPPGRGPGEGGARRRWGAGPQPAGPARARAEPGRADPASTSTRLYVDFTSRRLDDGSSRRRVRGRRPAPSRAGRGGRGPGAAERSRPPGRCSRSACCWSASCSRSRTGGRCGRRRTPSGRGRRWSATSRSGSELSDSLQRRAETLSGQLVRERDAALAASGPATG